MKINKKFKRGFLIGLLILILGVFINQARKLKNVTIKLKKIVKNKINLKEVDVVLVFNVVNTSKIGLTVQKQIYNIFINGKFVKQIVNDFAFTMKGKSNIDVPLSVVLNQSEMKSIGLTSLGGILTGSGLMMSVKGNLSIGQSGKTINLPVKISKKII